MYYVNFGKKKNFQISNIDSLFIKSNILYQLYIVRK